MTDLTPLDIAHDAMMTAPDNAAARLQFYHCLADTELFMLLEKEVTGDSITPEVFDLSDNSYVLVFDTQDRMATFTGATKPYAALSGRMIAALLMNNNIGLGVNLDVAPSAILIPPTGLAWLTDTLENAPEQITAKAVKFNKPNGVDGDLLETLKDRILHAGGVALAAFLVSVDYENGTSGTLIGFVDTPDNARDALAKSVTEALIFSGLSEGAIDVAFFASDDPVVVNLARVGHQFDLPKPVAPTRHAPTAPGSDPEKPPVLK